MTGEASWCMLKPTYIASYFKCPTSVGLGEKPIQKAFSLYCQDTRA